MPRRENSLPAPPSGKAHRPAPRKIHPRRQHDSRRDVAWRVSTRAPKCYNTQPKHLRAQANLGVSFLETQNRVNRPCSALICKRNFAHGGFQTSPDFKGIKTTDYRQASAQFQGFKPALISKGLRPEVTGGFLQHITFQTSPDFKGIKTQCFNSSINQPFQTSPDFKGIKTLTTRTTSHPALFQTSPDFKGIKTAWRAAVVAVAVVSNQP